MLVNIYLTYPQGEWNAMSAVLRFDDAVKAGLKAVGEHHLNIILPRHFKGNNKYRYNHNPRKPGYIRAKFRRKAKGGGNDPVDMVWSGKFKEEALERSDYVIQTDTAIIRIKGRVLNLPPRNGSLVNLTEEITTVTDSEKLEYEKVFEPPFLIVLEGLRLAAAASSTSAQTTAATVT